MSCEGMDEPRRYLKKVFCQKEKNKSLYDVASLIKRAGTLISWLNQQLT